MQPPHPFLPVFLHRRSPQQRHQDDAGHGQQQHLPTAAQRSVGGGWWDWRVFVPQRPKLALGVGRFVRCIVSILVFVPVGFRMAVALRERGKRGGSDPFFPSGWGDLPLTFEGEGQGAAPFVVHPPPFPHPLHPPPHSKGPTKSRKVDHPEGLPV